MVEQDDQLEEEADDVLNSVVTCVDRGEGQGRCHMFLDHSDICVCGSVDLNKERMK